MLEKTASSVLASFRPSTGTRPPHHSAARTNLVLLIRRTVRPGGYASAPHSLRPCWTAFLSILHGAFLLPQTYRPMKFWRAHTVFQLDAILRTCVGDRQPLHVARCADSTVRERDHMVDVLARPPVRVATRWLTRLLRGLAPRNIAETDSEKWQVVKVPSCRNRLLVVWRRGAIFLAGCGKPILIR